MQRHPTDLDSEISHNKCSVSKLTVALIWPCMSSLWSDVIMTPVRVPYSNTNVTCFAVQEVEPGETEQYTGDESQDYPEISYVSMTRRRRCEAGSSKEWKSEDTTKQNLDLSFEKKFPVNKDIDILDNEKPSSSTKKCLVSPVFKETETPECAASKSVFRGDAPGFLESDGPSTSHSPIANSTSTLASHELTQSPSHTRTPSLDSTSNMKPLYWTRVSRNDTRPKNYFWSAMSYLFPSRANRVPQDNGIWQEMEPSPVDNMNNFTDLFARETDANTSAKLPMKSPVLQGQRGINIAILMHSIHEDFTDILIAIENLHADDIDLGALKKVKQVNPTDDEIKLIRAAMFAGVPLTYAERCIFNLSEIFMFRERLSFLIFEKEVSKVTTSILTKLAVVIQVSQFLLSSVELKKLFSIILTLGNRMNNGHPVRGSASGFKLDTLNKLKNIKSKAPEITLLHFIVRSYVKCCFQEGVRSEKIKMPIPPARDIRIASEISLAEVQAEIADIAKQRENCLHIKKKIKFSAVERRALIEFIADVKKAERKLQLRLAETRDTFKKLMQFYRFTSQTGTLKEFYDNWVDFTQDFQNIWEQEIDLVKHTKLEGGQLVTEV